MSMKDKGYNNCGGYRPRVSASWVELGKGHSRPGKFTAGKTGADQREWLHMRQVIIVHHPTHPQRTAVSHVRSRRRATCRAGVPPPLDAIMHSCYTNVASWANEEPQTKPPVSFLTLTKVLGLFLSRAAAREAIKSRRRWLSWNGSVLDVLQEGP